MRRARIRWRGAQHDYASVVDEHDKPRYVICRVTKMSERTFVMRQHCFALVMLMSCHAALIIR